jgi:hypothetical protein
LRTGEVSVRSGLSQARRDECDRLALLPLGSAAGQEDAEAYATIMEIEPMADP